MRLIEEGPVGFVDGLRSPSALLVSHIIYIEWPLEQDEIFVT